MNGRCPEENRHGSFLLLLLEWCNLGDKDDSELSLHHEFNPSSTKIGHVRAKTLLDYIKSINNPFDAGIRLQNISTGADIPQEVVDGLLECLEIGEKSYEEFVKTRFQNKEKHLHDTIPTNRKTVFVKRISTPSTAKKSMAKKDAAETIRYINYARERGYSMLELLKYELTSTSQFLTTECKDGIKLKKPDKASLARELVSHLPQETRNVKSDAQMTIVDFMALVRKLPMKKMGLHTFEELAKSLSDRILATGSVSTRIDIIFDVYQKSSIKQMERAQRSSSEEITMTIRSDNQKLPVNLDMFWSSMLNKVRLQEKLLAGNETQIAELSSNQEEADDRIMFHINDGVVKHGVQSVLVDSPDTDVFVNLIFHFNTTWQLQKLYVKLGNRKTKKTVPVHLLVDQLDNGLVSCLPAIHALSGCDSTKLSPQITSNAEKLLVSGLKKTDCSTFDEYRWEQYHNSKKELDFNQLVCCSSTIREHIKRAYLQCKMWLQAPTPVVTKPDPLQYGSLITDDHSVYSHLLVHHILSVITNINMFSLFKVMEKEYKTEEDGAVSVNGSKGSNSHDKQQFASNYVEEWNNFFMHPDFAETTKKIAMNGVLRNTRFRSICWKLHLDCLPEDQTKWIQHTREQRQKYEELQKIMENNPRGYLDNRKIDLRIHNPLSQEINSHWNTYFQDSELREIIQQDVERTFPEIEFFQAPWVKKIMVQMLFCYAKEFSKIAYKQGMHELLAPLIFVIYSDQQAFLHAAEGDFLQNFFYELIEKLTHVFCYREMVKELMDPQYLEHDAYTLFCTLMDSVEQWYLIRDIFPYKRGTYEIEPFSRPDDTDLSNIVILKLKRISDSLLKKHDSELYHHLEKMEIVPQMYGIRWLRLLFGREFSLQDLLVVWDALFADGPSLGLVDYVFVSMLIYIRHLLLTTDYAKCLQFLMRYPAITDVNYIIKYSLFLRDPMKYVKPIGHSEQMLNHVPTVGGIPNIHRAPTNRQNNSNTDTFTNQLKFGRKPNINARPKSLTVGNVNHSNSQEMGVRIKEKNLGSNSSLNNLPRDSTGNGLLRKGLDIIDSGKIAAQRRLSLKIEEHGDIKNLSKQQQRSSPVPVPRAQKKVVFKKSLNEKQSNYINYEDKLNEFQSMRSYCSSKMTLSIDKLQDTILLRQLDNEDDMLLALAALKQVRDILQGTLKFSENLEIELETNKSQNNHNDIDSDCAQIHKSTLTVNLQNQNLLSSNLNVKNSTSSVNRESATIENTPLGESSTTTDHAIEALLSSDDCVEPQVGGIQFNEWDSE
ncbi:TBC1 domain family member 5 [Nymphon striatum]|nr:TBC1 domain family member 5 [Nymphon striatum]